MRRLPPATCLPLLRMPAAPQQQLLQMQVFACVCPACFHGSPLAWSAAAAPVTSIPSRSNVDGCDCCLSDTATVGACFQVDRQCGPGYCNCKCPAVSKFRHTPHISREETGSAPGACFEASPAARSPPALAGEGRDPGCVVSPSSLLDLLEEWRADPVCGLSNATDAGALACSANYLAAAAESPQAQAAGSLLKLECDGMVQRDTGACGPGKMPLISVTAQHQIHIFIFSVIEGVLRFDVLCCAVLRRAAVR